MAQNSVVSLDSSSSLEEIQLLKHRLEYRRQLLDALLQETHRELQCILDVTELNEENNPITNYPDTELPLLINKLSQSFIDFVRIDFTKYENLEEKEEICIELRYQSSLLRNLLRHLELQIAAASETLEYMEPTKVKDSVENL